jgi:hypothetical protein
MPTTPLHQISHRHWGWRCPSRKPNRNNPRCLLGPRRWQKKSANISSTPTKKYPKVKGPNDDIFLVNKEDVDHIVHNFVFCPPLLTSLLLKEAKDKSGSYGIGHIRSVVTLNAKEIFFPFASKQASPLENALCAKAFIKFSKLILTFLQAAQNGTITLYNFFPHEDPDGGEQLCLSALITFGVYGNLKLGRYKEKGKSVDGDSDGTERNQSHAPNQREFNTSTPTSNTDTATLLKALELLTQNQAGMQEQLALESTKSIHATSKSKTLFGNLPPQSQLIFKRASAESHVQEV